MKTFIFGDNDAVKIAADTVDIAIKLFKIQELFPEKFVDRKDVVEKGWDGNPNSYTDVDKEWKFKKDPKISVSEDTDDKRHSYGRKLIKKITLQECIEADYNTLIPKHTNLLESHSEGEKVEEPEQENQIISRQEVTGSTKIELRMKMAELATAKQKYEVMVREMSAAVDVIRKELSFKMKILGVIETFLGVNENIIQICEGKAASEDEPLSLYQQTLYMDEEIGIWEDGGIDFLKLDVFDEWISKNYQKFLYKEKSVCVFRVRRNEKDYGDPFVNSNMNAENMKSYFLIRNGQNLYRIWSDIWVGDTLFPRKGEYEALIKEYESWGEERLEEKAQDHKFRYLYGCIAIQGLIERTEIFGTALRAHVNLASGKFKHDDITFIRDAESEFMLSDGRPCWDDFLTANRKCIKVGTRVVLTKGHYWGNKDDNWRISSSRASFPEDGKLYQIEEEHDEKDNSVYHNGWRFLIRYLPDEEVWDWMNSHKRKNKVSCRLYKDEVLNYDDITLEQIDYYFKLRLERPNYLNILPVLYYVRRLKLAERKLEDEFVKLIQGQLQWEESQIDKIKACIEWWKLKNKWKRALTKDEAKAVRMILKKLRAGTPIEYLRPTVKWIKKSLWKCEDKWCSDRGGKKEVTNDGKPPENMKCKCGKSVVLDHNFMVAEEGEPEKVRVE